MEPGRGPAAVGPGEPAVPPPPAPPVRPPDADLDRPAARRQEPADHHMRGWPRAWREGLGYHVRVCPHGIGHPDPEDVVDLQAAGRRPGAHRCDGCCVAPLRSP